MEGSLSSMNMIFKKILMVMVFGLLVLSGCKSDAPEMTIPYTFVYEEININDLRYQNLKQAGGFIYLNDLGYKGIAILSDGNGNYTAFDRACPFHPDEDCALVEVHSSGFYLEDECCGSTFDATNGLPLSGPARAPLLQYSTFLNGVYLVISNQ